MHGSSNNFIISFMVSFKLVASIITYILVLYSFLCVTGSFVVHLVDAFLPLFDDWYRCIYLNSFIPCFHVTILFDSMYLFLAMFWSRLIGCLCSFLQVVLIFRSRGEAGHGILKENDSTTVLLFIHTVLLQWMVEWRFSCVICFLFDCLINIIQIPVYTMCSGFTI
jgi:hypothetical protein